MNYTKEEKEKKKKGISFNVASYESRAEKGLLQHVINLSKVKKSERAIGSYDA